MSDRRPFDEGLSNVKPLEGRLPGVTPFEERLSDQRAIQSCLGTGARLTRGRRW